MARKRTRSELSCEEEDSVATIKQAREDCRRPRLSKEDIGRRDINMQSFRIIYFVVLVIL